MNEINHNLKFYRNYFHGIQDIIEHQSATKVGLGLLKVITYATIIVPIIFEVGYLITQSKQQKLSNLYQRVSKAVQDAQIQPSQQELTTFLIKKVQDEDYELFTSVFKQLNLESQRTFFKVMTEKDKFGQVLEKVPEDMTEMIIGFGDFFSTSDFQKAVDLIRQLIDRLNRFSTLKHLTIDMQEVAYCTPKVIDFMKDFLALLPKFATVSKSFTILEQDGFGYQGAYIPNNLTAASLVLYGLAKQMHKPECALENAEVKFADHRMTIKKSAATISADVDGVAIEH